MKIIEVERCAVDECPYCIPTAYNNSWNYCNAFKNQQRINAKLKTFPHICPLQDKPE